MLSLLAQAPLLLLLLLLLATLSSQTGPAPQPRPSLMRPTPDHNDGHGQKRRTEESLDPDPNVSDVEHSPIPGLVRHPRRPGPVRRRRRKLIGIDQRNCVQHRTRTARTPTELYQEPQQPTWGLNCTEANAIDAFLVDVI